MVHVSSFARTSRASQTLPRLEALSLKPFLHQSPQFDFECMSAPADGCTILTEPRLKEIGKLNEAGAYLLVLTDFDAGRLSFA